VIGQDLPVVRVGSEINCIFNAEIAEIFAEDAEMEFLAGKFIGYHEAMDWKENLLTTDAEIDELLRSVKRIAVLGIKPESHSGQPAYYVPKYMQNAGFEIIPVPVYYPEVNEIMGEKVYRRLSEVPGEVDMLNVFRRSQDVSQHVEAVLEKKPKSVWLQLGIWNDDAAEAWAKAGIKVVQNLCLMVEHRALLR